MRNNLIYLYICQVSSRFSKHIHRESGVNQFNREREREKERAVRGFPKKSRDKKETKRRERERGMRVSAMGDGGEERRDATSKSSSLRDRPIVAIPGTQDKLLARLH